MSTPLIQRQLVDGLPTRPPRPIVWLAVLGALVLALQASIFLRWIVSDDFRPADAGTDPVPTSTLIAVRVFEVGGVLLAVVMIWWAWKTSRHEGRLSIEAVLILAWVGTYWQDPGISWGRPGFFYNAHFVNMSSWTGYLPGAINPTASRLPEPLLCMPTAYIYGGLLATMFVASVMRRTKKRFPGIPVAGLIAVGVLSAILLDLIVELVCIRLGLYVYPTTIHQLSLLGGTRWQFPVYESVFWGSVWAAAGTVYYFRDDKGRTILDRGIDRVHGVIWRSAIRVLAVLAFLNIVYAVYNVLMIWTTFQSGPMPEGIPSWLIADQCGPGTEYACPSPNVAIPLPHSGPTQ